MRRVKKEFFDRLVSLSSSIMRKRSSRYYFLRATFVCGKRSVDFCGYPLTKFAREIGHILCNAREDNILILSMCRAIAQSGAFYDATEREYLTELPRSSEITIKGNANKSFADNADRAKFSDFVILPEHVTLCRKTYDALVLQRSKSRETLRERVTS